jgi:hypothetical protein
MSILKYTNKANPAASAKNVEYITRDSAADSISFHNLDELQSDDKTQAKSNAINYAEQREIEEESRIKGNERGTPRNHNRMIVSFDRKEETETAKEEVHKFLDKEFSNQKAVVSIHQDGDHTHAHIWFDCRDKDTDRKTQIEPKKYRTLDERWARQYDERYGTNYEREYKEKKAETREWKREQVQLKKEGKQPRPRSKPARTNDQKTKILKAKELKDHGIDKEAARNGKPTITRGHSAIRKSERTLDNSGRELDRAAATTDETIRGADERIREAKTLHSDIERRDIERDRDTSRGR